MFAPVYSAAALSHLLNLAHVQFIDSQCCACVQCSMWLVLFDAYSMLATSFQFPIFFVSCTVSIVPHIKTQRVMWCTVYSSTWAYTKVHILLWGSHYLGPEDIQCEGKYSHTKAIFHFGVPSLMVAFLIYCIFRPPFLGVIGEACFPRCTVSDRHVFSLYTLSYLFATALPSVLNLTDVFIFIQSHNLAITYTF